MDEPLLQRSLDERSEQFYASVDHCVGCICRSWNGSYCPTHATAFREIIDDMAALAIGMLRVKTCGLEHFDIG
jgi:hypothetical protein